MQGKYLSKVTARVYLPNPGHKPNVLVKRNITHVHLLLVVYSKCPAVLLGQIDQKMANAYGQFPFYPLTYGFCPVYFRELKDVRHKSLI